ncbi:hypothetical protein Tco_0845735, partial [Tanacetum coccineum]
IPCDLKDLHSCFQSSNHTVQRIENEAKNDNFRVAGLRYCSCQYEVAIYVSTRWQSLSGGSTCGDGWPIRAGHVSKTCDPRLSGVCPYKVGMWRSKAMIERDPS